METPSAPLEQTQHDSWHRVTPLSKYLAMALFIVMPFIGGWIGYTYAPEKVVERVVEVERIAVHEKYVAPPHFDEVLQGEGMEIPNEYGISNYRTVAVVRNPFYSDASKYDSLVVTSERGINDYACGGMYVSSTCYFFLESSYADTQSPIFVGTWASDFPALKPETLKFISPTVVEFTASAGDAGVGVVAVWRFDTTTGSSTLISEIETVATE